MSRPGVGEFREGLSPVSLQGKSLSGDPTDFLQDVSPRLVPGFGDVKDGGHLGGIASAVVGTEFRPCA